MDPTSDPRPIPPEKPLPTDCCDSGCAVCVLDAYAEELAYYEDRLAAWHARHPCAGAGGEAADPAVADAGRADAGRGSGA